jgi:sugar phosphate isomerase/epimerase
MIYISTGGYSNLTLLESVNLLLQNGFTNLELSGCRWSANDIAEIIKIKSRGYIFQPHNYFPSQESPFVLNLASLNEKIKEESLRHCERAILLSSLLGQKHFSVHAGFLIDPKVEELGKTIKKRTLNNRAQATEMFIKNIKELKLFADQHNLSLIHI